MNRFEKKALAKRAYRALVKMAELPPVYTPYIQRAPYKPGSVTPQPIPTWSGPTPPLQPIEGAKPGYQPPKINLLDRLKGYLGYGSQNTGSETLPKITLPPSRQRPEPPVSYPVFKKDVTPRSIPTDKVENPYRYPDGRPMPKYHYPQNGELFDL